MSPAIRRRNEKRSEHLVGEGLRGVREGIWKRARGIESRE